MTCEEADSSDAEALGRNPAQTAEQVGVIVEELVKKAKLFEPTRLQLKLSVYNLEKKLQ
jgi:hypothetical protein